MGKVFRVDSRIVHSQTINYWCKEYKTSKIIVANDDLAIDNFKQLFFKIATSNEVELEFVKIEKCSNIEYDESLNYMIIFENINDVIKYTNCNGKINKLIISNSKYEQENLKTINGVLISEEDNKKIKILEEDFNVEIQYKAMPN